MAGESSLRKMSYVRSGCNAFDAKRPISMPLGHWLEKDIWDYIGAYQVPICDKIYRDMGYKRTGCMWCAFGAHFETEVNENRFQKLQLTHPKIHKYCMEKLGLKEVLEYIGVKPYRETTVSDWMK